MKIRRVMLRMSVGCEWISNDARQKYRHVRVLFGGDLIDEKDTFADHGVEV